MVTVYRAEPVSADITVEAIGAYLARTGWELVQLGDWSNDVLGSFKLARWKLAGRQMTLRSDLGTGGLTYIIAQLATIEHRHPADVLADVASYPLLDRGTAMVEAREALSVAETALKAKPKKEDRIAAVEQARGRLAQTELDLRRATLALEAVHS